MLKILLAAGLTLPGPVVAQALTPTETAKIDRIVADALASTKVPSASVAVVRGGRLVFARAYGKQSERGGPADPKAPYQIASISKQFTAAALLLLEDEGKLSLDDPVAKYMLDVTDADRITLRQLLNHTSGLQDYWPQDYSFAAMKTATTPQQIVDRWAKKPLDFAPGTQWQYSNTGYVVAGMIVEKVAGVPLLDFLDAKIFKPLGMKVVDQDLAVGPGYPQGYKRFALGPVRPETPAAPGWLYAAGELAMSASDLARWDIVRINRSLLPADDWAAQETPAKLSDGSSSGYGLGVFASAKDGRRQVEHGGEAVGFLSENIVFPDEKAAVVVLTNSWFSDAASRISDGIVATVVPRPSLTTEDAAAIGRARTVFDQLRSGRLDRSRLTDNANSYFTATAQSDYRTSLSQLGEPTSFSQAGRTRLRGGFVNRVYRITFPKQAVALSTYSEPGAAGRFEQFLVAPIE